MPARLSSLRLAAVAAGLVGAVLVGWLVLARPLGEPRQAALARQAEVLLDQAERARDAYQAQPLVAEARSLLAEAASGTPGAHAALVARAERAVRETGRIYPVEPQTVVEVPAAEGSTVAEIAAGGGELYVLNIAEGTVRSYDSRRPGQALASGALLLQRGATVGGVAFDTPVAMAWLPPEQGASGTGSLITVDRQRGAVQVAAGPATRRPLPGSEGWQRIDSLAGERGTLYVLDAEAAVLQAYTPAPGGSLVRQEILSARATPAVPLARSVEVLAAGDLYLRQTGGVVRRFNRSGTEQPFDVRPPDGPPSVISAMAGTATAGLYLADAARARIIHVTPDGRFVRQLRPAAASLPQLAGLRSLQLAPDGQRLLAIGAAGILAIPLPAEVPAPIAPAAGGEVVRRARAPTSTPR